MKFLRVAVCVMALAVTAGAVTNPFGMVNTFSSTSVVPVDVKAPNMDFEQGGKVMVASGGVTVKRGDEVLKAERIVFDKESDTATASGHVVFTKSNLVWRGETFSYNLKDGTWSTGAFNARFEPFHVMAHDGVKSNDCFVLNQAEFTTCTNEPDHYHYSMRCKTMRIYPDDHLVAYNMVVRFGGIPMLYLPYWYCAMDDRSVGTSVVAGYRSRMGAFILTSTKYWMTPTLRGITHVDYRSARGPAIGQEVGWVSTNKLSKGRLYGYVMNDQGVKKDFENGNHSTLVDENRYRVSLEHFETLSPDDYFIADGTYLSDPYVLADFFEREYRNSFQPQNYAMVMHRDDNYSLSLSAYSRLNDFFESVDRLPELAFAVPRVEIGDSPFYYEGENSAAFLRKSYVKGSGAEDYSSARFDTSHELFYPTRNFGFLNITPRAGFRETYYSDTVQYSVVTQAVVVWTTNTTTTGGTTNQVVTSALKTNLTTVSKSLGSDVRSLVNLGVETSFRAFKVLDNEENAFGTGWRHVVEPYADYTLVPEPDLRPSRIYQFDEIDALDMRDDIKFGIRNRLQTKRSKQVTDVVILDVFTTYSFEEANQDQPFTNLAWNAEFHPSDSCHFYADGEYDPYAHQVSTFNTRALLKLEDWHAGLEHRYHVDDSSLLTSDLGYAPNKRWDFGVYDRYEFQTSRLEEQGVTITHSLDCMALCFGGSILPGYTREDGSKQKDEFRVTFQLWLSAFPNVKMGSGPRN